jgi:hypothetical protein
MITRSISTWKDALAIAQSEHLETTYAGQPTTKEILSSKYDKVDTQTVAQAQKHLSQRQRDDLGKVTQRLHYAV